MSTITFEKLPHHLLCLLKWKVARATAVSENSVKESNVGFNTLLQDIRHELLRNKPCTALASTTLKSPNLSLTDSEDHHHVELYVIPHLVHINLTQPV